MACSSQQYSQLQARVFNPSSHNVPQSSNHNSTATRLNFQTFRPSKISFSFTSTYRCTPHQSFLYSDQSPASSPVLSPSPCVSCSHRSHPSYRISDMIQPALCISFGDCEHGDSRSFCSSRNSCLRHMASLDLPTGVCMGMTSSFWSSTLGLSSGGGKVCTAMG